jgi:hypothetical protein
MYATCSISSIQIRSFLCSHSPSSPYLHGILYRARQVASAQYHVERHNERAFYGAYLCD